MQEHLAFLKNVTGDHVLCGTIGEDFKLIIY
jgi:hypothetical protein